MGLMQAQGSFWGSIYASPDGPVASRHHRTGQNTITIDQLESRDTKSLYEAGKGTLFR